MAKSGPSRKLATILVADVVGLNLGDVIIGGENLYGDWVNIAVRLEASAEPRGITLSGKFYDEEIEN